MSNKYIARINLNGKNIRPDTIGMGELGDLLKLWEQAIKAAISPLDLTQDSGTKGPIVSLVEVKEGNSSDMGMAMIDIAIPAFGAIAGAIAENSYASIPVECHEKLYSISRWAIRNRSQIEIEPDEARGISHAVIDRNNRVEAPSDGESRAKGETSVYGYLISAGGRNPRFALEFPNGGKIIITADEEMTKLVSQHLYEEVGIEGIATWNTSNWKMIAFSATRLLEYSPQSTDLSRTFEELARASRGRWEGEEADKFIEELRGESQP